MHSALLPILDLVGGVLGILIGSFSPLLTSAISPFGDVYVRLMEVVVLPYLVSSLILGLGQLAASTAVKLFRKSWMIYVILWFATFTVVLLMAFTVPLAKRSLPSAKIRIIPNYDRLSRLDDVDAAIWTLGQAKAWAISHDGFAAVVPRNTASRFLFGYLMPPGSGGLAEYLNYWMNLEQKNGVMGDMMRRWIHPAIKSPQE